MGKRGEGWVAIQLVLVLVILFAPRLGGVEFPDWLRLLGGTLIVAAVLAVAVGIVALGQNLTPFPKPVPDGHLITDGIYGVVRHPLYSGAIAAAAGWGLATANVIDLGLAALLFAFFDLKSRREEEWLAQAYPEYATYRLRVSKLVPWIY